MWEMSFSWNVIKQTVVVHTVENTAMRETRDGHSDLVESLVGAV